MKAFGLPLMVLGLTAVTAGLGYLLGLGGAIVLAALTALFCLMAAFGESLRADLKLFAVFAPTLVIGAGVPRLLGEVSSWAPIVLLAVVIFVASLIPALGQRYVTVGLGLGMASLFGYGFQMTGTASVGQVLGAPALAVGVAVLLRLLAGMRDPGKPTRAAIADVFIAGGAAMEKAVGLWLGDRPTRWTRTVLGGAARFGVSREILMDRRDVLEDPAELDACLAAAKEEAEEIAELIRAREAPDTDSDATLKARAVPTGLPGDTERWLTAHYAALDLVRMAATTRDRSPVDAPPGLRRKLLASELRGAFSWRSAQLRHAVRCTLGVVIALCVAKLRPGDPLTLSFIMTTFAIMQPQWRDSLTKAGQRIGGALGGAVVLAAIIWLLPSSALLPIGLVAVLAGMMVMRTQPIIFNGCMVLMSIAMNTSRRHLEPVPVLIEYLLLMIIAVAVGLLFGFAAVPGVRKPSPAERLSDAINAIRTLLRSVGELLEGELDRRELGPNFRASARAQQNLLAVEPGSKAEDPAARETAERAADAVRGLHAAAITVGIPGGDQHSSLAGAVSEVADALPPAQEPDPQAWERHRESATEEQRLVLDAMITDLSTLHRIAI